MRGIFLLTPARKAVMAAQARAILCKATRQRRLVPPLQLAFAGLAQTSYLAMPVGRFMRHELYDCLSTRRGWSSRRGVRLRQRAATLLMYELSKLWWLIDSMDIELRPLCLQSAKIILADYSRLAARVDYMLDPALLEDLQRRCGR
jgi:hypothetical protein